MDKTPLESSIREESERAIRAIKEVEFSEIRKLDEDYAAEMENFSKKSAAEIDAKIKQELSRLENRGILDRKKLKLRIIEKFINHIVDEAVKGMRNDQRYKKFLSDTVCDAVGQIQTRAEIRLKKEDIVFKKEIMDSLKAAGRNRDIGIKEDSTITWGGCIVHDEQGGRIFNNTIERVYFRKSFAIRQEIVRILKEKGVAF
ncbi:MAG: V-type ATP synthase subunit E family protein [Syntrophales bacterium]|nr:V-type ATP synthase subunit E family protein [Syntrophales bacterium]